MEDQELQLVRVWVLWASLHQSVIFICLDRFLLPASREQRILLATPGLTGEFLCCPLQCASPPPWSLCDCSWQQGTFLKQRCFVLAELSLCLPFRSCLPMWCSCHYCQVPSSASAALVSLVFQLSAIGFPKNAYAEPSSCLQKVFCTIVYLSLFDTRAACSALPFFYGPGRNRKLGHACKKYHKFKCAS